MNNQIISNDRDEKIAAIIDARKLALQSLQLERELHTLQEQDVNHQQHIQQLEAMNLQLQRFADEGRMEMQRIKDETLARLRAIVHFSGEHSRLQTMKNLLTQDDLSIDEMKRWHKNITEEFHNLYPAQAASLPADDAFTQSLHAQDYASYQLRAQ